MALYSVNLGLFALTKRENEVFSLVVSGLSNDEIAAQLFLEVATVKSHVASLFTKLGVHNRVQATIAAYDAGMVVPKGELLAAYTVCTACGEAS